MAQAQQPQAGTAGQGVKVARIALAVETQICQKGIRTSKICTTRRNKKSQLQSTHLYVVPRHKDIYKLAYANSQSGTQLNSLLEQAQQSTRKANADVSFKRPDRAYIEWIKSSDILLNLIPRHAGYPDLNKSRGELHERYRSLYKVSL